MKTLIERDRVIAIAGLAKNTGKTTTLNALITHYNDAVIGVTSIGLDGEALDTITRLPKPDIVLNVNTIFATARKCLAHASGKAEVLRVTDFPSALGNIVIARVTSPGAFLIAGPTTNKALNAVIKMMRPYTQRIFIDGALDRKTFSAVKDVDACILATGGSVAKTIEKVVEHTSRVVKIFSLPATTKAFIDAPMALDDGANITRFDQKDPSLLTPHLDTLRRGAMLHINGAFTERFTNYMIRYHLIGMRLVVSNPTMFILSPQALEHFEKLAVEASVHHPIKLRFITINPTRPHASAFDKKMFETMLTDAVDIPVFNVKSMEVCQCD